MASSTSSGDSSPIYYYFTITICAVAVLLILSNIVAFACCSTSHPTMQSLRRRLGFADGSTGEAREIEITHGIPAMKYRIDRPRDNASNGCAGECGVCCDNDSNGECSVCLSAFADGEDVRQMPRCKHLFHAACIDMWLFSHANCPLCRAPVYPVARNCSFTGAAASSHHSDLEAQGRQGRSFTTLADRKRFS
uniref:RING-type domain-containing protein n=1 Tax=Ananas comosus var. bracteatus TaxID=296719 RepID=A0A6V7NGT8_ANACO|nr:unnamed protein product [Ananas comosus var. bracteatus]